MKITFFIFHLFKFYTYWQFTGNLVENLSSNNLWLFIMMKVV